MASRSTMSSSEGACAASLPKATRRAEITPQAAAVGVRWRANSASESHTPQLLTEDRPPAGFRSSGCGCQVTEFFEVALKTVEYFE